MRRRPTWTTVRRSPVRDGRATSVVAHDALIEGVDGSGFNALALDEAGNVLFGGNAPDGSGPYYGVSDGTASHLVMTPQTKMPDGKRR